MQCLYLGQESAHGRWLSVNGSSTVNFLSSVSGRNPVVPCMWELTGLAVFVLF